MDLDDLRRLKSEYDAAVDAYVGVGDVEARIAKNPRDPDVINLAVALDAAFVAWEEACSLAVPRLIETVFDFQECISEIESHLNAHPEIGESRTVIRQIINERMFKATKNDAAQHEAVSEHRVWPLADSADPTIVQPGAIHEGISDVELWDYDFILTPTIRERGYGPYQIKASDVHSDDGQSICIQSPNTGEKWSFRYRSVDRRKVIASDGRRDLP